MGPWVYLGHGYPSQGGPYVLSDCTAVEIGFLGHDRLNLPRTFEEASLEDENSAVRRLGAIYWEDLRALRRYKSIGEPKGSDEFTRVGWPGTGGVWVLSTTLDDARMIEKIGGSFYPNPRDCPYLDLS
ncbi:hypothetical protein BDW69DRAFT_203493 [Aspergillus filifer]